MTLGGESGEEAAATLRRLQAAAKKGAGQLELRREPFELDAYEGTGLGPCRRFAELMGGDVRAESESGRGSSFTFTLPRGARS